MKPVRPQHRARIVNRHDGNELTAERPHMLDDVEPTRKRKRWGGRLRHARECASTPRTTSTQRATIPGRKCFASKLRMHRCTFAHRRPALPPLAANRAREGKPWLRWLEERRWLGCWQPRASRSCLASSMARTWVSLRASRSTASEWYRPDTKPAPRTWPARTRGSPASSAFAWRRTDRALQTSSPVSPSKTERATVSS